MIRVTVNNRGVQAIPLSPVTVGAEGIVAAFLFSDDWAGLAKTAIFKGSGEEVEKIVLNNQCTVPPEVLTEAGGMLQVGVYGNDGLGTLIRPTIWGVVGRIEDSAISEDAGQTGTTPSWAAQVQNAVQEALIVAQGVRTDADAGEFDGATFTPSVAADGTLSWTNDKEKENPQPVNIKGPQGPQGNPGTSGQDGVTPDFQIGSVETLNPGQSATATITGTPAQPVLNLGIPQGEKGEPGGGSGTSDYTQLSNKPQINGHTLSGNQSASDLGLGTYSKPASGIPKTDFASDVQASLGKADSALQTAPVTSVNSKTGAVTLDAGDIGYDNSENYNSGTVGHKVSELNRHLNDIEDSISDAYDATASYVVGDFCINDNTLYRCNTAIPTGGEAWTPAHWDAVQIVDLLGSGGGAVSDVQIDGTSILDGGVANIPLATANVAGVAKVNTTYGVKISNGVLFAANPSLNEIKSGVLYKPPSANQMHQATFYGLAKAAGDATQSASSNPVGTYTDEAKAAIKSMLGVADGGGMNIVNLSGTQITQVGADNTFYVCGELTELTFTAPAVGITMIRFTSGTTPTVLTVNGVTSWMFDNDPTAASLEANKTYDINVLNGVGVVGWA